MLTEDFTKALRSAGKRIVATAITMENGEVVPSKFTAPADMAVKALDRTVLADLRETIDVQPSDVQSSFALVRAWNIWSSATPPQKARIMDRFLSAYERAGCPECWSVLNPALGLLH